jgi:hypothetical protein
VASGVNNAIARAAGLTALSVIPVISGLTAATDPADVTHAFRIALIITACVAAASAPLALFGLERRVDAPCTSRRIHCPVDGTPLQATPSPAAVRPR